jgi:hypothetical protein
MSVLVMMLVVGMACRRSRSHGTSIARLDQSECQTNLLGRLDASQGRTAVNVLDVGTLERLADQSGLPVSTLSQGRVVGEVRNVSPRQARR